MKEYLFRLALGRLALCRLVLVYDVSRNIRKLVLLLCKIIFDFESSDSGSKPDETYKNIIYIYYIMPRKVQGGRKSSRRGLNMRPGGSLYTNQERSLYVKTLNASKDVNAGDNLNASETITTKELNASDKITTKSIDGNDTIVLNGTDGKIETNELTASVKITTKSCLLYTSPSPRDRG